MLQARTRKTVTVTLLVLALSGCATMSGKDGADSGKASEYSELYDGDMQVLHEAGQSAITAEEAVANGDRALSLGNTDQALFEYVHALQISGGDAGILNKIGAIHARLGNRRLAAQAFVFSLRLDPDNAAALEGVGLLLLQDRRYEEASKHLNAALGKDAQRWRSYNGLGMIADLEGDHAAAAAYYRQALDIQTGLLSRVDEARLLNNLGYSLYMSGDWENALFYFRTALNRNPKLERAWQNIGLVYTRQAQYDRALDAFLQVMEKPEA
ncbi:MAG: tetratricopeptide repeat protein, partial [Thiohalobacterales bacterium]|nr:tetratricopeptide repeat protein [Thiohalobacterales bacterium]